MIINSVHKFGYFKSRPASHKLEGIRTTQHGGMVLASYPKPYPKTSQQKRIGDAAKACGIKKGMSRSALVTAMVDCIPGKFGR